ncbi:MAG: hypothetical protein ABI840_04170 [bacterium]
MKYMQYFLSLDDVEEFNRSHEISKNISDIWEDFLIEIGNTLKQEAISKGLSKIEFHPVDKLLNRKNSRSMMFWVENPSQELKMQLLNYEYLIIVLLNKQPE